MKRLGFIVLFCLVVSALVTAQGVSVGAKAGMSLGWFSGSNWEDYVDTVEATYGISVSEKPYPAFTGGIYLDAMFTDNVGFVTEASYTTYGQKYEYSYSGVNVEGEFSQDALQIPFLLKLATQPSGGLYAVAGPTLLFLLGDYEFEESGGGTTVSDSQTPDNSVVFGILGGVGYGFDLDNGVLAIELRYGRNLTDAFDENPFDTNSFQTVLGYGLQI